MTFLILPTEIVTRIISFLDTPSPLDAAILQKPKTPRALFYPLPPSSSSPSSITSLPLQNLSLTSHFLRILALPFLFKHSSVHPLRVRRFLTFLKTHDLQSRILTITAPLESHYTHLHPAWWSRLLDALPNLTTFSIIAPPEVLDALAGIPTGTTDAWAFDMAYQILRLEQTPTTADSASLTESHGIAHPEDDGIVPTIFTARNWHSFTLNEGSSLQAYTTYEFFLRRTPSLLTALHFNTTAIADPLFAGLRKFSFIAIFPFYNHVEEVLKSIHKMHNLEFLSVKLCPDPDSTVFRDEIERNNGHMDVNDPWNECETSWMLIAHMVVSLTVQGGRLTTLHMADVQIEAVRETLEKSIIERLQRWWSYDGEGSGLWHKRAQSITPSDASVSADTTATASAGATADGFQVPILVADATTAPTHHDIPTADATGSSTVQTTS